MKIEKTTEFTIILTQDEARKLRNELGRLSAPGGDEMYYQVFDKLDDELRALGLLT